MVEHPTARRAQLLRQTLVLELMDIVDVNSGSLLNLLSNFNDWDP